MFVSLLACLAINPAASSAAGGPPGPVYIDGISKVNAESALLTGSLVAHDAETHWRVEYATSESAAVWQIGPQGTISAAEASETFSQIEGELTGLAAATKYYVRLFAENENGHETSSVTSFETGGAPLALTFATHSYAPGGEAIRLLGSVEPHGYKTHYHFEYVSQEAFAAGGWSGATSTPELDVGLGEFVEGSGFPDLLVGQSLPALQAGDTYDYRLVASSVQGTVNGTTQSLVVPAPGNSETPACPNEQLRTGPSARLPDCRAYEQVTPAEKGASMDNWAYSNVQTTVVVGEDGNHVMVSPQFSKWGPSPDATNSSYFFARGPNGWQMTSATPQPQAGSNSYRPTLFDSELTQIGVTVGWSTTVSEGSPNLEFKAGPPGGPYTTVATTPRSKQTEWVAASADFSKLVLASEDHDLLGHETGTAEGKDLYEYVGGQLHQLNVETDGKEISTCGAALVRGIEGNPRAEGTVSSPHAVSADGSRVFFQDNCSKHLYMRVHGSETVDIGAYTFLAANARGSELLLETGEGEGPPHEFFRYDTATATAKHLFTTHNNLGLPLVSEDMSTLYFRTAERLTPEAPSPSREAEHAGSDPENLYRYDIADESLRFVAQTSQDGNLGGLSFVTPDGRYYYWASEGVAGVAGEPGAPQSYRYDSVEDVVQCMSCASPFDASPKAFSTFLPEQSRSGETPDLIPDSTVSSENGDYVFFDTPSSLVLQDAEEETLPTGSEPPYAGFTYSSSSDIYEWRKNGIDGCAHVQGCLALISSGKGGLENILLGTTASGRDVFFATHSALATQDTDAQGDLYDARIGGGTAPPPPSAAECEGAECSKPLSPPIDITPSSSVFNGAGNIPSPSQPKKLVKEKKAKPKKKPAKHLKRKQVRKKKAKKGSSAAKHSARSGR